MLIALSLVSCDKADEPWSYRDRFYVQNQSSFYLGFDGESCRQFPYNRAVELGLDELNITDKSWGIRGVSIKWSRRDDNSTDRDSILELKDYTLYPSRHEIVKNDTIHMEYRDHHYVFTDSVLRDMKDSMRVKGILPQKVKN